MDLRELHNIIRHRTNEDKETIDIPNLVSDLIVATAVNKYDQGYDRGLKVGIEHQKKEKKSIKGDLEDK